MFILVYENDRFDETFESTEGHASRQAVWTGQRW
jgi:hypothetical protein